jgi:hypothetical protein
MKDPVKTFIKNINKNNKNKISYEEVLSIIENIAKTHRGKKFGFMTEEDIESQVRLICIQQIKFFDITKESDITHQKSLERWLNKIVKNRLKNFYRDHCLSVNKKHATARQNLSKSASSDIEKTESLNKNAITKSNIIEDLEFQELRDFIIKNLDSQMLEIYEACISDEAVTPYYKNKLIAKVNELMIEWNKK